MAHLNKLKKKHVQEQQRYEINEKYINQRYMNSKVTEKNLEMKQLFEKHCKN